MDGRHKQQQRRPATAAARAQSNSNDVLHERHGDLRQPRISTVHQTQRRAASAELPKKKVHSSEQSTHPSPALPRPSYNGHDTERPLLKPSMQAFSASQLPVCALPACGTQRGNCSEAASSDNVSFQASDWASVPWFNEWVYRLRISSSSFSSVSARCSIMLSELEQKLQTHELLSPNPLLQAGCFEVLRVLVHELNSSSPLMASVLQRLGLALQSGMYAHPESVESWSTGASTMLMMDAERRRVNAKDAPNTTGEVEENYVEQLPYYALAQRIAAEKRAIQKELERTIEQLDAFRGDHKAHIMQLTNRSVSQTQHRALRTLQRACKKQKRCREQMHHQFRKILRWHVLKQHFLNWQQLLVDKEEEKVDQEREHERRELEQTIQRLEESESLVQEKNTEQMQLQHKLEQAEAVVADKERVEQEKHDESERANRLEHDVLQLNERIRQVENEKREWQNFALQMYENVARVEARTTFEWEENSANGSGPPLKECYVRALLRENETVNDLKTHIKPETLLTRWLNHSLSIPLRNVPTLKGGSPAYKCMTVTHPHELDALTAAANKTIFEERCKAARKPRNTYDEIPPIISADNLDLLDTIGKRLSLQHCLSRKIIGNASSGSSSVYFSLAQLFRQYPSLHKPSSLRSQKKKQSTLLSNLHSLRLYVQGGNNGSQRLSIRCALLRSSLLCLSLASRATDESARRKSYLASLLHATSALSVDLASLLNGFESSTVGLERNELNTVWTSTTTIEEIKQAKQQASESLYAISSKLSQATDEVERSSQDLPKLDCTKQIRNALSNTRHAVDIANEGREMLSELHEAIAMLCDYTLHMLSLLLARKPFFSSTPSFPKTASLVIRCSNDIFKERDELDQILGQPANSTLNELHEYALYLGDACGATERRDPNDDLERPELARISRASRDAWALLQNNSMFCLHNSAISDRLQNALASFTWTMEHRREEQREMMEVQEAWNCASMKVNDSSLKMLAPLLEQEVPEDSASKRFSEINAKRVERALQDMIPGINGAEIASAFQQTLAPVARDMHAVYKHFTTRNGKMTVSTFAHMFSQVQTDASKELSGNEIEFAVHYIQQRGANDGSQSSKDDGSQTSGIDEQGFIATLARLACQLYGANAPADSLSKLVKQQLLPACGRA